MTTAARASAILFGSVLGLWIAGCTTQDPDGGAADDAARDPVAGQAGSPGHEVPDPAPVPEFGAIGDVTELKRTFYGYLHPLVSAETRRVRAQRQRLEQLRDRWKPGQHLPAAERTWLEKLAAEYEVALEDSALTAAHFALLQRRVDVIPAELALAQAAIESGWGRSRFARQGNNIYGEWCFVPGCGLVPKGRRGGARHEVATFDHPAGSVQSYVNNLNTHPAYVDFRRLRQRQRLAHGVLDAQALAATLEGYSTLREEYVRRVRAVMRQNRDLVPAPAVQASPASTPP